MHQFLGCLIENGVWHVNGHINASVFWIFAWKLKSEWLDENVSYMHAC